MLHVKGRGHGSDLNFKEEEEEKKTGSFCVIFIKGSSFTPPAARPQLQGNQTHLYSPEERSSLTAAFNTAGKMHTSGGFIQLPVKQECSGKLLWHSNDP